MSEHTENIRRAVKTGYEKLVDALDRMEKERDELRKANEDFVLAQAKKVGTIANLRYLVKALHKYYPHKDQHKCSCDVCVSLKDMGFLVAKHPGAWGAPSGPPEQDPA